MMQLIEQQAHFWELYQSKDQYYLSIAVDMSSVISCWDIALTEADITQYQHKGRIAIEDLANSIVAETYRGDFSNLERNKVAVQIQQQMQMAFKVWKTAQD